MTQSTSGPHFFERLWEAKAIQITISYLLGAWAIIQFVDWMVNRYAVNQVWTDMALVFFIALIPAVLLFAYQQTKDEPNQFSTIQKVAFPSNLLIAGVAAYMLFLNAEPAAAQSVVVTDEEGQKIERMVPLRSNNKRMVVFPMIRKTAGEGVDWKGFSIGKLLEQDLEQNRLLYVYSPFGLKSDLESYSYTLKEKLPLGVARQIAEDKYTDYFIMGTYEEEEDLTKVDLTVYETKTGKEVSAFQVVQGDIFTAVDELSAKIHAGIFTEDQLQDQTFIDLPARDLITGNDAALQLYTKGRYYQYVDFQPQRALALYEASVKADQKSALAYFALGNLQRQMGDNTTAKTYYARALDLSANLPERQQLNIKVWNYNATGEFDKVDRLLNMWMQLYPDDYIPYTYKINIAWDRMDLVEVENVAKQAIDKGNFGAVHNTLFYSYLNQGNFQKAEEILEDFFEIYPVKATKGMQRAVLYYRSGRFDEARKEYERLNVLRPRNARIIRNQGYLEMIVGSFDEAMEFANKSMAISRNLQDTTWTYNLMIDIYRRQGKINQAIDLLEQKFDLETKLYVSPEIYIELFEPLIMQMYADNGRLAEVRAKAEAFTQNYAQGDMALDCMLDGTFSLFAADNKMFKDVVERCGEGLKEYAGNKIYIGLGISALYDEDYAKAVKYLEEYKEKSNNLDDFVSLRYLIEAYRLNGQLTEAQELAELILKVGPFIGKIRMEYARVLFDKGEVQQAISIVESILSDQWSESDPEFMPAQVARETLSEWKGEVQ